MTAATVSAPPRHSVEKRTKRRRRLPGTTGRCDAALFALAVQTGLGASELIGLCCRDVHLGSGAHVSCHGKGRKQRITPLTSGTVAHLRVWLAERAGQPLPRCSPRRSVRTRKVVDA
ncbi:MAG: tyrosine-type recombinase/integrase [Cypionkella sp.]|nr:tyrosine-type recombinase/integrase [Cypionkella sp.]